MNKTIHTVIQSIGSDSENEEFINSVVKDAIEDAKKTIAHAKKLVKLAEHSRFLQVK